jgi:hypothetical protein
MPVIKHGKPFLMREPLANWPSLFYKSLGDPQRYRIV